MAHQNVHAMKATAQNAAVEQQPAADRPDGVGREPRSYVAADAADATVAGPGAGETPDYMDEGDPSFGAHQGANHTNREFHAHTGLQGPKTRKANRDAFKGRGT